MTTPNLQANSNANKFECSSARVTQGKEANEYEQACSQFLENTDKLSSLLNELKKSPKMISALTVGQIKEFKEDRVGRKESFTGLPRLSSLELSPVDTQVCI